VDEWWQTFLTLLTMILGGVVYTQGRRTFLRAGRHRFRLVWPMVGSAK
jgi:hypothetical protein